MAGMGFLGALTSPDVTGVATASGLDGTRPLLLVPIGSCEQHGPHLPLDTDTRIAVAIATRAAVALERVLVAPAIALGASGEHAGFPGTLSIGNEVLAAVVVELVRSADWAGHVVVVNGHGGNSASLEGAARVLHGEGRPTTIWSPSNETLASIAPVDAHAGRIETSVMLALAPWLVRRERAAAGDTRPLRETWPELRAGGVQAVSPNGVLGDPTGANAAEGHRLVAVMVDDLRRHLLEFHREVHRELDA